MRFISTVYCRRFVVIRTVLFSCIGTCDVLYAWYMMFSRVFGQSDWKIYTAVVFWRFFSRRLRILKQNYTCLLHFHIYVELLKIFQLSPTLTQLCHMKRDRPVNFYNPLEKKTILRKIAISLQPYDGSPRNLAEWCRMGFKCTGHQKL